MKNAIAIDPTHPALPGHFPGNPVVPGALIIEHTRQQLAIDYPSLQLTGIEKLKFLRPLKPTEAFYVDFAAAKRGGVRFKCLLAASGDVLVEGHLAVEP